MKVRLLAGGEFAGPTGLLLAVVLAVALLAATFGGPRAARAQDLSPQRPGHEAPAPPAPAPPVNPGALAPPGPDLPRESIPVPDRWRLLKDLGLVRERWYDPYHPNPLKGDRPIHGDWFLNLSLTADLALERRRVPAPASSAVPAPAGYAPSSQLVETPNLILGVTYAKGDTAFHPPDYRWRLTAVAHRADVNVEAGRGLDRSSRHVAVQNLYLDKHLRNVSYRYDFDSLRVGIQPVSADFRGWLWIENPFGVRLYGTRAGNVHQYNVGWFRPLAKDPESGLNDLAGGLRRQDVLLANWYWQDSLAPGYTSEFVLLHDRDREPGGPFFDGTGLAAPPASLGTPSPRTTRVTYLGYNGDGHIGWLNLSVAAYGAVGRERNAAFVDRPSTIRAWFSAAELSRDLDWRRVRLSALYASGDHDPFDGRSGGFDAVRENPLFAGADASFWIRHAIPDGNGGAVLTDTHGVLASLRSRGEPGRPNFTNPGTVLLGLGTDLDLLPELRVSADANRLWFADTAVLEAARNRTGIGRGIGWDLSCAATWRPWMTQNVILRVSVAALIPEGGYRTLFGDAADYATLTNVLLTY